MANNDLAKIIIILKKIFLRNPLIRFFPTNLFSLKVKKLFNKNAKLTEEIVDKTIDRFKDKSSISKNKFVALI